MGLDQQREGSGVTDERPERPDIDERHDPCVLALDDRELILEGGLGRGEIVHEIGGADHGDDERQHPHQAGILQVDSRNWRGLVKIDKADTHQDRREQLNATDTDVSTRRVQPERPTLHTVGIEEGDIGHA